jgi:hypothetical protein
MALEIYFPVILQSASQFLLYDTGVPIAGTFGLPINTRIYSYHPSATHDALTLFNSALGGYFTLGLVNDRQAYCEPDYAGLALRLVDSTDGLKLARLLGLYDDGPPLDLTYYQDNELSKLDPCGVTLQSLFPGDIGYMHDTYDLGGAPDFPAVHVVSDAGAAAQIAGDPRYLLDLSLRSIPGALFSALDLGSFTETFSATFWQAYNPAYSAPYVLIIEDDKAYEYAIRKPIQSTDARSIRDNWKGHFNLDLQLQKIGEWTIS